MKKFLNNTIVQLLIAVVVGILAGFYVEGTVLSAIISIKHLTGQIIFFLVPLIILGFIAPSIAHLRSNASKMLLFAFGIAYLSSVGASFFGAAVGYQVIPHLDIASDANTLKELPENMLKIDIPPVMNVMTALVLAALIGIATAWVKSDEFSRLLDIFQQMVLEMVKKILLPVLPVFIFANFCILSYQGAVTKQLPIFISILLVVIVCHYIWLALLYGIASIYSRKNGWQVLKYYGPAYLTALGTMSSAATLGVALNCAHKSPILRKEISDVTVPLFANIHLCGSVLTETFFVMIVHLILKGTLPTMGTMILFCALLAIFAIQDSFGTACNVTGDGALTLMLTAYAKKHNIKEDTIEAVEL